MMDIRGLAYVVAQSTDLAQWRGYAENVLGMMATLDADGSLRLKMDERQHRFIVQPGPTDCYLASGWEVQNAAAFQAAMQTLVTAKVSHTVGDAALCTRRGVQQLVSFADPSGNQHEVVWGFRSDFTRFVSPVGVPHFVTTLGDGVSGTNLGMGHAVLPTTEFEATVRFATEVMGFALSDIFNFKPAGDAGPVLPIHFFHCGNGRHHSLALCGFPVPSGCVHVMVEVGDMAEVGRALDRMLAHGVTQTATLGQHTNDRMTSFYMRTPSNFEIEFGHGGAVIDWHQHITHEFTKVSLWGHDFSIGQPKP